MRTRNAAWQAAAMGALLLLAACGDSSDCDLPPCFSTLMDSCDTTGSCVVQSSSPTSANFCFANGVRASTTASLNRSGDLAISGRATRPDGTTCFTFEGQVGSSPSSASYKDQTGNLIGTVTNNSDDSVTYVCQGQPPKIRPASCKMSTKSAMPGMGVDRCVRGSCM
jgi:hypothetical protein